MKCSECKHWTQSNDEPVWGSCRELFKNDAVDAWIMGNGMIDHTDTLAEFFCACFTPKEETDER